jgi:hypothetical protein
VETIACELVASDSQGVLYPSESLQEMTDKNVRTIDFAPTRLVPEANFIENLCIDASVCSEAVYAIRDASNSLRLRNANVV